MQKTLKGLLILSLLGTGCEKAASHLSEMYGKPKKEIKIEKRLEPSQIQKEEKIESLILKKINKLPSKLQDYLISIARDLRPEYTPFSGVSIEGQGLEFIANLSERYGDLPFCEPVKKQFIKRFCGEIDDFKEAYWNLFGEVLDEKRIHDHIISELPAKEGYNSETQLENLEKQVKCTGYLKDETLKKQTEEKIKETAMFLNQESENYLKKMIGSLEPKNLIAFVKKNKEDNPERDSWHYSNFPNCFGGGNYSCANCGEGTDSPHFVGETIREGYKTSLILKDIEKIKQYGVLMLMLDSECMNSSNEKYAYESILETAEEAGIEVTEEVHNLLGDFLVEMESFPAAAKMYQKAGNQEKYQEIFPSKMEGGH